MHARWFTALLLAACNPPQAQSPAPAPDAAKATEAPAVPMTAAAPARAAAVQKVNYASPESVAKTRDVIAQGKKKKPNILIIWGDDIGWMNPSAYHRGMMGYQTPNIDRIAQEGMLFTDSYGEQSCTAGRAAFLLGQHPFRTGLTKVGMPGAKAGISAKDPTIAELLKNHGYATGQFGKNHLGDRDEHLPTNHGFDEFFGNLYHLNAEEEPEHPDYPKNPAFRERFGPRGVIRSKSDGTIEDTGPLTKKRMETTDQDFTDSAIEFMKQAQDDDKPFFVWWNSTRMHIWTHLPEDYQGVTGKGIYADGMQQHDYHVGQLLDYLDEAGLTEDTIVMYSTDNGAEVMTWPDGGTTPFHGEKATTWEGGFRVPTMVRWPGRVPAGVVSNEIISHQDWMPTLLAAVGEDDVKEKLLRGHAANGKRFRVHLDGYNQLDMLLANGPSARNEFFYFTDDGGFSGIRYNDWKALFSAQEGHGFEVWQGEYETLRVPYIFNLRADPFERARESMDYNHWLVEHVWALYGAQALAAEFIGTFQEFPQRQKIGSFNLDNVLEAKGTQ